MKVNIQKLKNRFIPFLIAVIVFWLGFLPFAVSAEKVTDLSIDISNSIYYPDNGNKLLSVSTILLNNQSYFNESDANILPMDYLTRVSLDLLVNKKDKSIIAFSKEAFSINIANLSYGVAINGNLYPVDKLDYNNYQLQLIYTDGTIGYINSGISFTFNPSIDTFNVSFDVLPEKDVSSIRFFMSLRQFDFTGIHGEYSTTLWSGFYDMPLSIVVDIVSKTDEKLDGIGNQLDGIGNQIDGIINGTPEQNQQADKFQGDINSAVGDLDSAGDVLSGVEKPEVDMDNIVPNDILAGTAYNSFVDTIKVFWDSGLLSTITVVLGALILISYILFGEKR